MIVGTTYLEHGRPVVALTRWASPPKTAVQPVSGHVLHLAGKRGTPRNVLIRREAGQLVVRPFRGLRRPPEQPDDTGETS